MDKITLWLDDLRNPFIDTEKKVPVTDNKIVWVLNYDQFTEWINLFGLPDIISFDHDLADEHYTPEEYWSDYDRSKEYQDAQVYTEKTGADCAKWLVDYCIDNDKQLPKFYVHSANPVGADKILGILNNYLKHVKENIKWVEFKGRIRSFRLGEEPEVIHIIIHRDNEYLVVHEDGYDLNFGKVEFLNREDVKLKYNIDI